MIFLYVTISSKNFTSQFCREILRHNSAEKLLAELRQNYWQRNFCQKKYFFRKIFFQKILKSKNEI